MNARGLADVAWHGTRLLSPGWNDPSSRILAFTLAGFPGSGEDDGQAHDVDLHVILNLEFPRFGFGRLKLMDAFLIAQRAAMN